jgi:hypothetical protein
VCVCVCGREGEKREKTEFPQLKRRSSSAQEKKRKEMRRCGVLGNAANARKEAEVSLKVFWCC